MSRPITVERTNRLTPRRTTARAGARAAQVESGVTPIEIAILLSLVVLLFLAAARATTPPVPDALHTMSVRVAPSETLWELASTYRLEGRSTAQTVETIRALNELEDAVLVPGTVLEVPAPADHAAALASR